VDRRFHLVNCLTVVVMKLNDGTAGKSAGDGLLAVFAGVGDQAFCACPLRIWAFSGSPLTAETVTARSGECG
jgi:hypothetical protein